MQSVKVIKPVTQTVFSADGLLEIKKKRVCAYARVSTDNVEQKSSYDAQIDEYEKRIRDNPEWEFVGIFADEGISGTSTKHRIQFNEMVSRVRNGEIDLILTKAISRFTRNTVDCLNFIREFRLLGVEIYFEKENIYSSDPKVDFLLTIMSSIAQEEARNVSENVKWNVKKRFKEGVVMVNEQRFLGYTKDKGTKKLVIVPEEAKIVKEIFTLYASGIGPAQICRICIANGYKTGAGKTKWTNSTLFSILKNEKYHGDLLLQKTISVDYLTKKRVKNIQLQPMYHVENAHEAIVSKELFDEAQKIMKLRSSVRRGDNQDLAKYNRRYPFSGIIICNECGRTTKRRYWNYGYPSAKVVQQCGGYIEGKDNCKAKAVDQDLIEHVVLDVLNIVFRDNPDIYKNLLSAIESTLSNNLQSKITKIEEERSKVTDELDSLVTLFSNTKTNQDYFKTRFNDLSIKIKMLDTELEIIEAKSSENYDRTLRLTKMKTLINEHKDKFTELTVDLVRAFIYRIITISKEELVVLITASSNINLTEFTNKRNEIIEKEPIYQNAYITEDQKRIMHYKVIMI